MEIKVEHQGQVSILTPIGEIDAKTVDSFARQLATEIAAGHVQLVGDLGEVSFMSSAGLRALLATLKETRRSAGDFRLAATKPAVDQVLTMTGFHTLFQRFATVADAVHSFKATAPH